MARKCNRQQKVQRKAKKAAKLLPRRRPEADRARSPLSASRGLDKAEELLDSGKYDQAVELLDELAGRYPRQVEILSLLAEAQLRTNDHWSYQATCERLTVLDPDEPMWWLALGAAAMANAQPATAERAFAHMTAAWPDHPETSQAREEQEKLHEFLEGECQWRGLDSETGFRVLLLHDEINLDLQLGKYDKVCETAARLLAICPTFGPALNNRCEAHFRSGRYAEAIADSRRVLQLNATNYHALSNLTRHLYLSGQFEEAQATSVALKACAAVEPNAFIKKAETFAILGDWQAVRSTVHDGQSVWRELGNTPGMAEHLAGVAEANLGDLAAAREHWRRAAAAPDAVDWANENLKDSKRPAGQRHGPWAFPLQYWLPRPVVVGLLEPVSKVRRDSDVTRIAQQHFEQYPQLDLLAGPILQRSDPGACELLIRLAAMANRPAIFAALKEFALGQRGSDDLRMQALMTLSQSEYIDGRVEVWREGSLHPMALISQEIYREPKAKLPPQVNDLMAAAYNAILRERGAEAERLLDEVLRLRPDEVAAQFNRAVAIGLQGRRDETLAIVRRIHREYPDYIFARAHLAENCIANRNLEEAKTLLAPITQKQRLHLSEHAAWCSANISLALAMGEPDRASSFLSAWEEMDPHDKRIKIWKDRIHRERALLNRLSRLLNDRENDAE